MNTAQKIINLLEKVIAEDYPKHYDKSMGLCDNIAAHLHGKNVYNHTAVDALNKMSLLMQWPEFSGDTEFPVPIPRGVRAKAERILAAGSYISSAAGLMYIQNCKDGNTGLYEGEYGDSRRRLAHFWIQSIIAGALNQ